MSQILENEIRLIHPQDYAVLRDHLNNFNEDIEKALSHFTDLDVARQRAKNVRYRAIENLGSLLIEFEKKAKGNKSSISWAKDGQEANETVLNLLDKTNSQSIFKSAGTELSEIKLSEVLHSKKKDFSYINASEYICNLMQESPGHPMHQLLGVSSEKIAEALKDDLNLEGYYENQELLEQLNDKLRAFPEFPSVGISNADFLVAENGSLVFADNEGHSNWISSCVSIHIVVVGIDKIVSTVDDMNTILPLHTAFHQGSENCNFTNVIYGPGKSKEAYGPTQLHIILLDNGRSDILGHLEWREMLYDLDAMSFLNSCVNYQSLNKNNYHPHLLGPLGTVLSPLLFNEETYGHLSFLHHEYDNRVSNPYLLNMQKMLLNTRSYLMSKEALASEPVFVEGVNAVKDRDKMNKLKKNSKFQKSLKKFTGMFTEFPFSKKTFNEWWRENK